MCMLCQARDPAITHYDTHGQTNMPTGTTSVSGALPVYSYDQIATYLTDGYWASTGRTARSYDVQTGGTITYNLDGLNAAGTATALRAFDAWSAVSGLTFAATSSALADMVFDDDNTGAYASSSVMNGTTIRSTINIDDAWAQYGDYYLQTYMHEIGHALGLGHTGAYNGSAHYAYDAVYANDSWQTSVMSYFSQSQNTWTDASHIYLATLQLGDIAAIQSLYGAPTTIETGNTTYGDNESTGRFGMDLSGRYAVAIVDNGGTDVIDLATRISDQRISLLAETYSDLNGRIGNFSIGRGTVIENAITGSGNDNVTGNDADNDIQTGRGTDIIAAGAGDDTLTGGWDADTLTGGAGADTFRYTAVADAGDTITDFTLADGDRVDLTGLLNDLGYTGSDPVADGIVTLDAAAGGAWITTHFGGRDVQIVFLQGVDPATDLSAILSGGTSPQPGPTPEPEPEPTPVSVDNIYTIDAAALAGWSAEDSILTDTDGGIDTLDLSTLNTDLNISLVEGTTSRLDGNAFTIQTGTLIENLSLGHGNDRATGNDAANLITGSAGADRLYGMAGDDTLQGGDQNDMAYGGDGDDSLTGDTGDDRLYGEVGNDTLIGGAGNDRLYGATGDDVMSGGDGNDALNGGAGDNILDGGNGDDRLTTGEGNDHIDGGNGHNRITSGDGDDTVIAGSGNDMIRTGSGNTRIAAGDGNNRVYAGDGTATITTGIGNDRISLGVGTHTITALAGNNTISTTGGDTSILTGSGNDMIRLAGGDNLIETSGGNNRIRTGDGNDLIAAGDGDDRIDGGAGDDIIDAGAGNNSIVSRAGNNAVRTANGNDRIATGEGDDTIDAGGGNNRIAAGDGDNHITTADGTDAISTGNGNDIIDAGDGANRVYSFGGNDVITTGAGTDRLDGGAGNDTISAGAGDDQLRGNSGDDLLNAGAGDDRLMGDSGNDTLFGGDGNDRIYTGLGNNTASGDAGDDRIYGNTGGDLLDGGAGRDTVRAGSGDDTINGGSGNDALRGEAGADVMQGGAGNDMVLGGAGDDIIDGGADVDSLTGGQGADVFVFTALADIGDTIRDFTLRDGDRIDVTTLLDSFGLTTQGALATGALTLTEAGRSAWLSLDHDGDAGTDALNITCLYRIDPTETLSGDWFEMG